MRTQARIISIEHPTAQAGIEPHCTDYRHSKFVKRKQYVQGVLYPQMARLLDTRIFPAITDEHFTVDAGTVTHGGLRLRVNAGSAGNFLSHFRLWEACAAAGIPLLILEDDAELPPANAANVMDALALFAAYDGPAVLHLLSAMPYRETGTKDFADVIPAGGLLKVVRTSDLSGTAAYAVTPSGAGVLYRAALRDGTLPTDGFIHRAFERSEIAVLVPERHKECFGLFEHWAGWNHTHCPAEL